VLSYLSSYQTLTKDKNSRRYYFPHRSLQKIGGGDRCSAAKIKDELKY
jgi:hypothetical protein